ncbi:MAG: tRNA (adenosine(37)-N6)-threonylcarbamoyltransferase complex ATPase subunit type 1 TsaE [Bacteroidales bacterium]|nr:tRNA (adenosine(37)-N6)-threonylcarbamoyltransferase complex ATPase subunit type 1 TsaE [Bacteroidales bacterium]
MKLIKVEKLKDLEQAAKKLIDYFSDQKIFAFYGKMGVGKTAFIQAICRYLGSADNITSPTFALINEYFDANHQPIYHMDFYRIKNLEEVFDLGYEDYFYSGNYCLIEWPEKIEPLLPGRFVEVRIELGAEGERYISFQIL